MFSFFTHPHSDIYPLSEYLSKQGNIPLGAEQIQTLSDAAE